MGKRESQTDGRVVLAQHTPALAPHARLAPTRKGQCGEMARLERLVSDSPALRDRDHVAAYVDQHCFPQRNDGLVGAELELLLLTEALTRPTQDEVDGALAHAVLPGGTQMSLEPGGQLELSSSPAPGVRACVDILGTDLATTRAQLQARGITVCGLALDPYHEPHRALQTARYQAMERYFDADGPAGRIMMCSTAATQVSVDVGATSAQQHARWALVHALGPVLIAMFANSPLREGVPTGWRSTRWATWQQIDATCTQTPAGSNPSEAWVDYVLDAQVMAIRTTEGPWRSRPGLRFKEWLEAPGVRPSEDDLAFHLSTLFPPVRPRGWLELRMIDAQPLDSWHIPIAVVAALCDDPTAADVAAEACEPVRKLWTSAAHDGLSNAALQRAAASCVRAASEALPRLGAAASTTREVDRFAERYVEVGRCPADDVVSGCARVIDARAHFGTQAVS